MSKIFYSNNGKVSVNGVEYDSVLDLKSIPFEDVETLVWKSLGVVGYDTYEINQFGQVRRTGTQKMIAPFKKHKDEDNTYSRYTLSINGVKRNFKAHTLVVLAFEVGAPEQLERLKKGELEIDHIDGCRANNSIHNLRIATRKENMRNIRKKATYKRLDKDSVKRVFTMFHKDKMTKLSIAKAMGISESTVREICAGNRHKQITNELMYLVA